MRVDTACRRVSRCRDAIRREGTDAIATEWAGIEGVLDLMLMKWRGDLPGPDWEAFGREVMQHWPEGAPDGFALQDLAEKHGLLRKVAFDPRKHDDPELGAVKGDPWYEFTYRYPRVKP